MSKFQLLITSLIIMVFSTGSIAWIKQIQQENLNQAQRKRIEIEQISKNSHFSSESLQKARRQTKVYLEKLEQTPVIPLIAEPSKQFRLEQSQLSTKLEQLDETLAILESRANEGLK